jgi:hypothetical protein
MKARAMLDLPEGWKAGEASLEVEIPAHTEGRIRLSAAAPRTPGRRRHVLGLSAVVDGRLHREFGQAIVDFLMA